MIPGIAALLVYLNSFHFILGGRFCSQLHFVDEEMNDQKGCMTCLTGEFVHYIGVPEIAHLSITGEALVALGIPGPHSGC